MERLNLQGRFAPPQRFGRLAFLNDPGVGPREAGLQATVSKADQCLPGVFSPNVFFENCETTTRAMERHWQEVGEADGR